MPERDERRPEGLHAGEMAGYSPADADAWKLSAIEMLDTLDRATVNAVRRNLVRNLGAYVGPSRAPLYRDTARIVQVIDRWLNDPSW